MTRSTTELQKRLAKLSRADLARDSLERFGALVLAADKGGDRLQNALAPEHLDIQNRDPDASSRRSSTRGRCSSGRSPGGGGRLRGGAVARPANRRHRPFQQRPTATTSASGRASCGSRKGLKEIAADVVFLATRTDGPTTRECGDAGHDKGRSPVKPKPDKVAVAGKK